MDEEEIDIWYEEEKQKCMDEYLKDIEAAKNREESQKKYEVKLNKIIVKYNKMMVGNLESKKPGKKNFLMKIKEKMLALKK